MEKIVAEFQGNVMEYFGDEGLSVFTSITQATHCVIVIQQQLMQSDPPVPLRIGLHIGELFWVKVVYEIRHIFTPWLTTGFFAESIRKHPRLRKNPIIDSIPKS